MVTKEEAVNTKTVMEPFKKRVGDSDDFKNFQCLPTILSFLQKK